MALEEDDKWGKDGKEYPNSWFWFWRLRERKKDAGTGLEKENMSPLISGTSFAGTPGAFLTFTPCYKQLPGYSLPESKDNAQKNTSTKCIWSVKKIILRDKSSTNAQVHLKPEVSHPSFKPHLVWPMFLSWIQAVCAKCQRKVIWGGISENEDQIWLMRSKSGLEPPSHRTNLQVLADEDTSLPTVTESHEQLTAGEGKQKSVQFILTGSNPSS